MSLIVSKSIESKLTSKHKVTVDEVKQCFHNREGQLLIDTRERHKTDPPTQWFISSTNKQRQLKIVFVLKDGAVYLKTAYEPNETELNIYRQYG